MAEYDEDGNEIESEGIQGLRGAKKAAEARAEAAEAELATARDATKELAFLKAGLDDSKQSTFFRTHYDGELTSEAIQAAAQEAGIVPDASQETQANVAAQAQMAAGLQGAETPNFGSVQIGPPTARITVPAEQAEMWTEYERALQSGPMGAQRGAEVLRRFGHEIGTGDTEPLNTSPNTVPLANQANRIL